jgi:hypothetical protein
MPKTESHVSERAQIRQFHGEDRGSFLVDWLNGETRPRAPEQASRRIADLLDSLKKITPYWEHGNPQGVNLADLVKKYTEKLKFYKGHPVLGFDSHGRPELHWFAAKAGIEEGQALGAIFSLGREGLLGNLRRCDECRRWIFARFSHQRFCPGGRCRERYFKSSEKWKAHRRAYSKKLYRLHKSGKVR